MAKKYIDPFSAMNESHRQKLIDLGIMMEDEEIDLPESEPKLPDTNEEPSELDMDIARAQEDIPGTDYSMQTEIIKFFDNNPAPEPQFVREYASSLGIDPDEFQFQMNILLTQLINLYLKDADELGVSDALTSDSDIDPEIVKLVSGESNPWG